MLLKTVLLAILLFVICIGLIILIAYGITLVTTYIDPIILVYAETFFILGLFMLLISKSLKPTNK